MLKSQNCEVKNTSFKAGEELTYVISYNWLFMWTEVGEVKMKIENSVYQDKPAYLLIANGQTYSGWDWFFKVRDTYKSYIDKSTLNPVFFSRNIQEGNYYLFDSYEFDPLKKQAFSNRRVKDYPWEKDTINLTHCVFDVLSAFSYARNIDFSKLKPGQTVPLTIILDQELYNINFRFLGTEKIKVKHAGEFECLKFSLKLIEGVVFEEGDSMLLWVTKDKNHIPVYIESPLIVGTVKARISNMLNIRYTITSHK